jgi:hypothetical protein
MGMEQQLKQKIRWMIVFFIVALVLSGVTAFPVYSELKWAKAHNLIDTGTMMGQWLQRVWEGVDDTNSKHHFMFYGYDWLAFAHIVIAMAFIGPLKDPVKNIWIVEWAMLACIAVIPLALICGTIRDIPWFHILIDCSFGIIGIVPLYITRRWIKQLAALEEL